MVAEPMTSAQRAEAIARRLHAGQVDKAGAPYAGHLERVVAHLLRRWPDAASHEVEAAWLHDALEDTDATSASLEAEGVSPATIRLVEALTRPQGKPYLEWVGELAATRDAGALRVKLADNQDNSDPARRILGSDMVEKRYLPARKLLEEGLAWVS